MQIHFFKMHFSYSLTVKIYTGVKLIKKIPSAFSSININNTCISELIKKI